jgi:hypothetical protein
MAGPLLKSNPDNPGYTADADATLAEGTQWTLMAIRPATSEGTRAANCSCGAFLATAGAARFHDCDEWRDERRRTRRNL